MHFGLDRELPIKRCVCTSLIDQDEENQRTNCWFLSCAPNYCVNWKIMIKHEKQKKSWKLYQQQKPYFLVCFQIFRKELSVLARSEKAAIVRRAPTQKPAQVEKDWSIFQKQQLRAKREERKSFQFLLFYFFGRKLSELKKWFFIDFTLVCCVLLAVARELARLLRCELWKVGKENSLSWCFSKLAQFSAAKRLSRLSCCDCKHRLAMLG